MINWTPLNGATVWCTACTRWWASVLIRGGVRLCPRCERICEGV